MAKSDLNLSERIGPSGRRVLGLKSFSAKPAAEPRLTEAAGTVAIARPRLLLKPRKAAAPASPNPTAAAPAPAANAATMPAIDKTAPKAHRAAKQARYEQRRVAWAAMTPEQQAEEKARRAAQDAARLDAMPPSEREAELLRRVRIEQRRAVRDWVRQAFPAAFPTRSAPPPLAIGIREKLIEAAAAAQLPLGAEQIADFTRHHCRSIAYLASLAAAGSQRHDLDGAIVGEVTDEQRKMAAGELKGTQKKIQRLREEKAAKTEGSIDG